MRPPEEVIEGGGPGGACCRACGESLGGAAPPRAPGVCPGCGQEVCFGCGCTNARACAVPVADGVLTCSWVVPGTCLFCVWAAVEHAYRTVTAGGSLAAELIEELAALVETVRMQMAMAQFDAAFDTGGGPLDEALALGDGAGPGVPRVILLKG